MQPKKLSGETFIKPSLPFFMLILASVLLGVSPIFVRYADVGPNAIGFGRVLIALPFLWIWMLIENRLHPETAVPAKQIKFRPLIYAGAFFSLDLATWHMSIERTAVVNAALFNNFVPFFVPIALWFLYREKPRLLFMIAVIGAIFGSFLLTGGDLIITEKQMIGDLLGIFSAVAYTGYALVLKQLRGSYNAPTIMLWTSVVMSVCLLFVAFINGEAIIPATLQGWLSIIGLALLIQVVGQGLLAYSMGHISTGFVALCLLLGPVVSTGMAWVLFDETLNWIQIGGGILVLATIVLARQDERRKTPTYGTAVDEASEQNIV
jgi:drug/metabolite transporter (DMT)-like permease